MTVYKFKNCTFEVNENFRFWLPYKKEHLALTREFFDTEPEFEDGKVDYEALERYYHEHGSYEFLKCFLSNNNVLP